MTTKLETYRSLLALSVGDALGENQMKILPASFYKAGNVAGERGLIDGIAGIDWRMPWTDDTHMAIGVVRILSQFGVIIQEELAKEFACNFNADPQRGYGRGTSSLLKIFQYASNEWESSSKNWWGPNMGSKGNGSLMRDSVIGAQFGPDLGLVATQAQLSAQVTHWHPDAFAGSIAVAVAAANATYGSVENFWSDILYYVPAGEVRDRIEWAASDEAYHETNWGVVTKVGNGKSVLALDTAAFALWTAHQALTKHLTFQQCIDSIIEVGGDTDTLGATFGGIVGNIIRPTQEQIDNTEPLPDDLIYG